MSGQQWEFKGKTFIPPQAENEYCLLLALPCGLDQEDVHNQTHALKTGFITYLQAKQAAGIINVPNPGSNQVSLHKNENYSDIYNHLQYRVQCEFS